jgi:hypothetical protein
MAAKAVKVAAKYATLRDVSDILAARPNVVHARTPCLRLYLSLSLPPPQSRCEHEGVRHDASQPICHSKLLTPDH